MGVLDAFERKGLFRLTRFLALCVVFLMISGAIIGVVGAYSYWPRRETTRVAAAEVIARLKPSPQSQVAADRVQPPVGEADALSGLVIPRILDDEFSPLKERPGREGLLVDPQSPQMKNRKLLAARMEDLSLSTAEKQTYLDELAASVAMADGQQLDRTEAINAYMELKQARINDYHTQITQAREMRVWAAGVVGSVLFLIAMFSMVLVLLAIERNTRPQTVE